MSFLAGLVADVGVEGEVAEEFAGGGVDDADVEVGDEKHDGGAGESAADADVVHSAGSAKGDGTGFVDAVAADPVVGPRGRSVGFGFREQAVDDGGNPAAEGSVGAPMVVLVDERVEEGLELGDRLGGLLSGEPSLEGLVEAFDFAAGGGVVRA